MMVVFRPGIRLWLLLGSAVLFGCQETDDTAEVELVIDLKNAQGESRIQVYEPSVRTAEAQTADPAGAGRQELADGQYFVSLIDDDSVAMAARKAPRKMVLLNLASQLRIALRLSEEPRGLVDLERFEGSAVEAIRLLLDGMAYSVDYIDQSENALPAIGSVNVGYLAKAYSGLKADQVLPVSSGKDADSYVESLGFPYGDEKPITIDQSLSNVFEYGSVEEMLELVNEIELTSAGVRILSDQLRNNPD
ncbi:MAG: hypothetical protein HKN85_01565, partial [Gammaproteobacteria bacterium]|nr:hypothetical protein [Gammaproteobacteria bacterium]